MVYDSVEPSPFRAAQHPDLIGCPGRDPALAAQQWYVPQNAKDTTLVFESRFESGNLRRAVQVFPFEYGEAKGPRGSGHVPNCLLTHAPVSLLRSDTAAGP